MSVSVFIAVVVIVGMVCGFKAAEDWGEPEGYFAAGAAFLCLLSVAALMIWVSA